MLSLFISVLSPAFTQIPLNNDNPKYLLTKSIFDKLTASFSNGLNEPVLIIAKKGKMQYIARFETKPIPRIVIDEELVDACNLLSPMERKSALALILGHELAHYYRRDNYYNNLGIADSKTHVDKKQLEAMADFEACYHAQINGFNPSVFGKTLDLIYRLYNLPENTNGYYPKAFRKKSYDEKLKELQTKVTFYEVGTAFYFNKNFIQATDLFQNISQSFPSREIWNNLGACYLQMGFEDIEISSQGFILPIEFDIKTRMVSSVRGLINDEKIEKAVMFFKKAIIMDENYWPAKINIASAYLCLNKDHSAIHIIEEGKNLPPDAYSILGIAYTHLKDLEKAKLNFEKAAQLGAYGADYNLKLFKENLNWWLDISTFFTEMRQYVMNFFRKENSIQKSNVSIKKIIAHKVVYNSAPVICEWKGASYGLIKKFQDKFGNVKYEISEKGSSVKRFEYRNPIYLSKVEKESSATIAAFTKKVGKPVARLSFSENNSVVVYNDFKGNGRLVIFENSRKQIEKWLIIK